MPNQELLQHMHLHSMDSSHMVRFHVTVSVHMVLNANLNGWIDISKRYRWYKITFKFNPSKAIR